jgi:ribosomal protein L37E
MNMNTESITLAQNRIDYIVYHNTNKVGDLLENYGFEVPENPTHLAQAMRELVRRRGRKVIKELIAIHPDKEAILKLESKSNLTTCESCQNDSYDSVSNSCSSCGFSNYISHQTEYSFTDEYEHLSAEELQKLYDKILKESNLNPSDRKKAETVQKLWNELRVRKAIARKKKQPSTSTGEFKFGPTKADFMIIGVTLLIGIVIGSGLNFKPQKA